MGPIDRNGIKTTTTATEKTMVIVVFQSTEKTAVTVLLFFMT